MNKPKRIRFSTTRIEKIEIYDLEDADFIDCVIVEMKIGEPQSCKESVKDE